MEPIHASICLENSCHTHLRAQEVSALVRTEALFLCLPAPLVENLGLEAHGFRTINMPGGIRERCRYVGPVTVQWGSHACFTGAVEFGAEVVLGSMPLDAMDVNVDALKQRLTSRKLRRFSFN